MSAITPQTNIYLIKNILEIEDRNQLTFANKQEQFNYFFNLPKLEVTNASYLRKDSAIRFPAHIDDILEYNYVMYQNENYSDKWFYAYITNMTYFSDHMTYISITTDVWQTWQFDITFKSSFIEREHVNNDTRGLHTVPENLETGEYIINYVNNNQLLAASTNIIIGSTIKLNVNNPSSSSLDNNGGAMYNNIPTSVEYYAIPNTNSGMIQLQNLLTYLASEGKIDAITTLFIGNTYFMNVEESGRISPSYTFSAFEWDHGATDTPISILTSLNGYTPKNNKCLCYPYCYLLMANNNGNSAIYHYEKFNDIDHPGSCGFEIYGAITPGMSVFVVPVQYNGYLGPVWNESLSMGKLPIGAFQNDIYTNWLTQNGVNIKSQLLSDVGNTLLGYGLATGGAITGNLEVIPSGLNQMTSGLSNIQNLISQTVQHSFEPPQSSGNLNVGDAMFAVTKNSFYAYGMSIKQEYAKIIDNFFSMYGYKVNEVKIPNLTGRSNWNYVKTVGANIEGYLPQEDLQNMKNLFNNGITLWHHPNTFLDYNQNNNII